MAMDLSEYTLQFPQGYDTDSEIWKAKGYTVVEVEVSGPLIARYSLMVYDPVRLAQDIESELTQVGPIFAEPNVVVVPTVGRDEIEQAVEVLARRGFRGLAPE